MRLQNGQALKPLDPSMFFFGPETGWRTVSAANRGADDETGVSQNTASPKPPTSGVRKHARESGPNGASEIAGQPAPKRSRKSGAANGLERNGDHPNQPLPQPATMRHNDNAMEIDRANGFAHNLAEHVPFTKAKSPTPADAAYELDTDMGNYGAQMDQDMEVDADAITGAASAGLGACGPQDQERMLEPPAPVYTLTNGHSVGVQMAPAKVADLKPETRILGVADDNHVTQIVWRPFDPSILAASGEQFCGLWKMSSHDFRSGAQQSPYHSLIDGSENCLVSAAAWDPRGSLFAIAIYNHNDFTGQLRIYDAQNNTFLDNLPTGQKMITSLRWQNVGAKLVGFACEPQDSSLLLWDLSAPHDVSGPSSITVPTHIYDVDWACHGNSSVICAAGDGTVFQYKALSDLNFERKWSSNPDDGEKWTFIRCYWWSDETAVVIAAAADTASIWIPSREIHMKNAHQGYITGLELRPNAAMHPSQSSAHEFATSSEDCTIKVWRFGHTNNHIETLFKVHMGHLASVMALSYSPDGFYLAGASYDQVKIWKADSGRSPVAQWDSQDSNWGGVSIKQHEHAVNGATPSSDGRQESDAYHSLSWDADSKKLAFGLGSQVSDSRQ